MPDTHGRYYLLPMLDMWTDVFASPGWRTTATEAQHFLVAPAGWRPDLIDRFIAEFRLPRETHLTDEPVIAQLKKIGIEPDKSFDIERASPAVRTALEAAPSTAQRLMEWKTPTLARVANHWSMNTDTMGVYGNYYLKRAIIAQSALGANVPEDAIYPVNLGDQTGTKTRFTPTRVRSRHRAGPVHTRRPLKGAVTMRKRTTIACTTLLAVGTLLGGLVIPTRGEEKQLEPDAKTRLAVDP